MKGMPLDYDKLKKLSKIKKFQLLSIVQVIWGKIQKPNRRKSTTSSFF